MRVQKEVGIAGDGEVIDRKRVERFGCLYLSGRDARTAKLRKTIRNEEDEDDQEAIARSLDLKVSEKRVGAEEVEGFVDDISLLDHSWNGGDLRSIIYGVGWDVGEKSTCERGRTA